MSQNGLTLWLVVKMETLLGKSLLELQQIALSLGMPRFVGKQLVEWLYLKRVTSFDEMTNLSLKNRQLLAERYIISRSQPTAEAVSQDGTRKFLFEVPIVNPQTGAPVSQSVEAVYIPEDERATLCVSTQAGCKMGCRFCMTGTLGFHGNLTAADILNQIFFAMSIDAAENRSSELTNIVFMGEGEPMDNLDEVLRALEVMTADWGCQWSPKRITVSTVGYLPGLKRFLEESECHLAISLHNPFHVERQEIMPAERPYPITDVLQLVKQYDFSHQRRLSFEYICFGGQNDTPKHAAELVRLLKGLDCRINLIRFHEGVNQTFSPSNGTQMIWLRDYLTQHGITTTIRRSRGEDILAACGMLVNALAR